MTWPRRGSAKPLPPDPICVPELSTSTDVAPLWLHDDQDMTNAPAAPFPAAAGGVGHHRVGKAALWSVVTIVAALLGAYLALSVVEGVPRAGGSPAEADFVNGAVWMTAFGLVVPVYLAARASFYVVPAVVLAAAWPQFYVAKVTIERYQEAGWTDGLAGLSEVQAGFMAAAFVVAALLGAGNRLAHQQRRPAT